MNIVFTTIIILSIYSTWLMLRLLWILNQTQEKNIDSSVKTDKLRLEERRRGELRKTLKLLYPLSLISEIFIAFTAILTGVAVTGVFSPETLDALSKNPVLNAILQNANNWLKIIIENPISITASILWLLLLASIYEAIQSKYRRI